MLVSIAFALAVISASAPVLMDEGVTELPTCRVSALAFLSAQGGWMFDHCGGVFRSSDGGRSWTKAAEIERQFFGDGAPAARAPGGRAYIQEALWPDARALGLSSTAEALLRPQSPR